MCVRVRGHVCVRACVRPGVRACVRLCVCVCVHTRVHAFLRVRIYVCFDIVRAHTIKAADRTLIPNNSATLRLPLQDYTCTRIKTQ